MTAPFGCSSVHVPVKKPNPEMALSASTDRVVVVAQADRKRAISASANDASFM
jgi:hypothetical protein